MSTKTHSEPERKTHATGLAKNDRIALTLEVDAIQPVMHEPGVEVYRLLDPKTGTRFKWRYTGHYQMQLGERYAIRARVRYVTDDGEVSIGNGRFARVF